MNEAADALEALANDEVPRGPPLSVSRPSERICAKFCGLFCGQDGYGARPSCWSRIPPATRSMFGARRSALHCVIRAKADASRRFFLILLLRCQTLCS